MMKNISFFILLSCLNLSCENLVSNEVNSEVNDEVDNEVVDLYLLENTLKKNSETLDYTRETLVDGINRTVEETKVMYQVLADKAQEVTEMKKDFLGYIEELRARLLKEGNNNYTREEAEKQGYELLENKPKDANDRDTPRRIFISGDYGSQHLMEPQGEALNTKLQELKKAYLDIIESLWEGGGIKGTIFVDRTKKNTVMLELKDKMVLTSSEEYSSRKYKNKTWAEYTFGNKSIVEVYLMLRKYENDVKLSELDVIRLLASQMGRLELVHN